MKVVLLRAAALAIPLAAAMLLFAGPSPLLGADPASVVSSGSSAVAPGGPTYNCYSADSCRVRGDGPYRGTVVMNCLTDGACVQDAQWTARDLSRAALAAVLMVPAIVGWSKPRPSWPVMPPIRMK